MDEKEREAVALFRYGLIAPILNGQVTSQKDYLAQIASHPHDVPHYGVKEFAPKTIEFWVKAYRRCGFEGLKPKGRSDKGSVRNIPEELKEKILALRSEHRELNVTLFYEKLVKDALFLPQNISYSTLYRFLKNEGLVGKVETKSPDRKRFSYEEVNILWQGDMAVGPYIIVSGKKVRTNLFAFIDDCSRLVPYAEFVLSEKFDSLKHVFKEALIRRGIPKMIYVDNGKVYKSDQFSIACASLGITLIHTKPYDAASKGKIERFFGTVRQRFLPTLTKDALTSIETLNQAFWRWLEEDYHRKVHSALEMSPLDMFMSQFSRVKMIDNPKALDALFLKREKRKVKHDGTISINSLLFEVPPQFIGQQIEVRFDPEKLEQVFIYVEGKEVAKALPVIYSDNARIKREKRQKEKEEAALSFQEMYDSREGT
ncbi:Mu transposase C-terminal domain-containing protein [Zhaonella formicivorans]|uniref:Mu transposase C-terminal domain-containing protein n=1 Tax=Zhaonella formicivorans TaxID=2528593 RepID=UPI0010D9B103|nr:Mu transposase C-terminal domain-containing protein [Zhaonella formicivorans]